MSASDTPTPRTDAIESRVDYEYDWLLEHSRQLERELAAANAIIQASLRALPVGNITTHTPESIPERIEGWIKEVAAGEIELRAAERLAEGLKSAMHDLLVLSECADETGYVDGHGFLDMEAIQKAAREALSAWEGRGNLPDKCLARGRDGQLIRSEA